VPAPQCSGGLGTLRRGNAPNVSGELRVPRYGIPQNAFMENVLSTTPPAPPSERQAGPSALDSGVEQRVGLAQPAGRYCGNGVCDPGENCATCAPDCKQARLLLCGLSLDTK
jgi:hypothetical protein